MKSSNNQRMNDEEKGRKINEEIYHNIQAPNATKITKFHTVFYSLLASHTKRFFARASPAGEDVWDDD